MKGRVGIPGAKLPSPAETRAITDRAETSLIETVSRLKKVQGHGQEQGDEAADGSAVNDRREALSVLMSRYSGAELERHLPKTRTGKVARTIASDIAWLKRAERQDVEVGRPFDFSWSDNPISTPAVLRDLAHARHQVASAAAERVVADPSAPYDASNDSLLCHLELEEPGLRSQVLADTLIQFRAARRTEALMDASLFEDADPEYDDRLGYRSSGVVGACEQRMACKRVPEGESLEAHREYALTRMVIANATAGAINGIYKSRNTVGVIPDYLGEGAFGDAIGEDDGFGASLFFSIHTNYSANTPKAIDFYLRHRVFTAGPEDDRVEIFRSLVAAARSDDLGAAQAILTTLRDDLGHEVPQAAEAASLEVLRGAVISHVEAHCLVDDLKEELSNEGKLRAYELLLKTHKSVVLDRPTADDLESELFYAGSAEGEVAAVIHTLRHGDHLAQVESLGAARSALRGAFFATDSAFERQMLWRLDRKVELISAEVLGTAVERAEASKSPEGLAETLLAARSALRGVVASGLESLRGRAKTAPTEDLSALLADLDAVLEQRTVSVDTARSLMTRIFQSATEVSDSARGFFKRREGAIHFSPIDVELDPEFTDSLIKETPLHYLLSLSQRGMTFGLDTEISADEIRLGSGVKTLNSVGPRVYDRVLIADDPAALKKYTPLPGPNDLRVIRGGNAQDIIYGGGLVLDAKNAGPGYSHASVFAKGHGISAIALPNLDAAIDGFFDKALGRQAEVDHPGFYVDDRSGSFVIKPLQSALDEGLLEEADIDRMRPGFNLDVDYFDADAEGQRVLADQSSLHLSDAHETRQVELFVPDVQDRLGLGGARSFDQLTEVPLDRLRQAAGEKGAVLVQLAKSEALQALGVEVPGGSVVPPSIVADLLKEAKVGRQSLLDRWQATIADPAFADPKVRLGTGDEPGAVQQMQKATRVALTKLLIHGGRPTKAGKALLAQLAANPDLAARAPWIFRSSFTGEDRPFKSGAGQYSSFPNCVSAKQRLEGLIGVIASAWNEGAIESNLDAGIKLEHVWPAVVVQAQVKPTVSGVAVSRGSKGGFQEVGYQARPKFGGGVEGGPAEEGFIRRDGSTRTASFKDRPESLLSEAQKTTLREAVLAIEAQFNDEIEPGKQYAVDVEWAFEGEKLHILQARVITGV